MIWIMWDWITDSELQDRNRYTSTADCGLISMMMMMMMMIITVITPQSEMFSNISDERNPNIEEANATWVRRFGGHDAVDLGSFHIWQPHKFGMIFTPFPSLSANSILFVCKFVAFLDPLPGIPPYVWTSYMEVHLRTLLQRQPACSRVRPSDARFLRLHSLEFMAAAAAMHAVFDTEWRRAEILRQSP